MRSLRRTLIVGAAGAVAAVLLAAGTLVYVLARSSLLEQFDRALIGRARLLASTVERESTGLDLEFDELDMGEFQRPDGPGYLQVSRPGGQIVYRSRSLGRRSLIPPAEGARPSAVPRWVVLPTGRTGRVVSLTFRPRSDDDDEDEDDNGDDDADEAGPVARDGAVQVVTLVLARDAAPVQAALESLRAVLAGVGLAAIAAASGVLWLTVRRGLGPLDQVADQIGRLRGDDLAARVEAARAPAELRPVVDRLNDLLERLEAAFERERAFSADVAHEMRTPLAGLRATLEVALRRPRRPAEYAEAMRDCLQAALRMQAMAESLLALARLESGEAAVETRTVVLDDLARSAWQPLEPEANRRGLQVRWARGAGRPIRTDPTLLGLVVANILENAVAHADEAGCVEIETAGDVRGARIRVANSGSLVPPGQTEKVFDRLWRADAARSAAGLHCGLGLAMVKRAVAVLGGAVSARSTAGGQFEIVVSIPPAGPPG